MNEETKNIVGDIADAFMAELKRHDSTQQYMCGALDKIVSAISRATPLEIVEINNAYGTHRVTLAELGLLAEASQDYRRMLDGDFDDETQSETISNFLKACEPFENK